VTHKHSKPKAGCLEKNVCGGALAKQNEMSPGFPAMVQKIIFDSPPICSLLLPAVSLFSQLLCTIVDKNE
jgi:hypothetical protein